MASLPTKAIDKIISLASKRHNKLPSPTGVADVFDFANANADDISHTQNKVAGSSVECLEYATSSSASPQQSSLSALRHFSNQQIAYLAINECASRFMHHVLKKTLTIVECCQRMTIHPADVAMALECFLEFDAKTDEWYCSCPSGKVAGDEDEEMKMRRWEMNDKEDWQQSDEKGSDEEVDDEVEEEDDAISEDEEEEVKGNCINVDTMQNSSNTSNNNASKSNSNKFDTAFPPLEKTVKEFSNDEFNETVIQPILEEMRSCLPMKKGVIDVLKSAMYAFLVSKLS